MYDYDYFVDAVWPSVRDKQQLPKDAEPTDEAYQDWQSEQPDAKDYYGQA